MRVGLFSSQVRGAFTKAIAFLSAIATFLFISVDVPNDARITVSLIVLGAIVGLYLVIWLMAVFKSSRKLNINHSTLLIKSGDLFEQKGLKAIAFNEYFDTIVDDKLISKNSLNGIYLAKKSKVQLATLNSEIMNDSHLTRMTNYENKDKKSGKKQSYKLGSIYVDDEYLLVAFSRFNDDNMAYLYLKDYIDCLITFWEEVDRVYAGRSVSLPLLGSGITRFKDASLQPQEILNILIWTFKISKVKFKHPSKATIVIHDSIKNKINLSNLDT